MTSSSRSLFVVGLVSVLGVATSAVHADVAATYSASFRANNLGAFCIQLHFDSLDYTYGANTVNYANAVDLICAGSSDGATVTIQCKSYPDDTLISFGGSAPAGETPPLFSGNELPFVIPVPNTATGSLLTALGSSLSYVYDTTTVIGMPTPAPVTLGDCTVPQGLPGSQVLTAEGSGALNVVAPLPTTPDNDTVTTTTTHTEWDPNAPPPGYVQRSTTIDLTFGDVTSSGDTTIYSASGLGGQFPGNFSIAADGYSGTFFDITTTAGYTPPIRVCAHYADADGNGELDDAPGVDEKRLAVLHAEGNPLAYAYHPAGDGTDYDANVICADVQSLSPFALAVALDLDGDGVYLDDNCPSTANADQVDGDGDGAGDACDICPSDPLKTLVGACGCGVVDTDTDEDGEADCVDPCTNDGAHDITIKPQLAFKRINTDEVDGDDSLSLKGEFVSGTPFSALNPPVNDVRIVLRSASGATIVDTMLPAGSSAAWLNKGTKWQYKYIYGKLAPLKIQIVDRSKKAANQLKIQISNLIGSFGIEPGDEPIKAIVLLGDRVIGECGETTFDADQCKFSGKGDQLKCK